MRTADRLAALKDFRVGESKTLTGLPPGKARVQSAPVKRVRKRRAVSPYTQLSHLRERDRECLRVIAARLHAPPAAVFAFLCAHALNAPRETLQTLFTTWRKYDTRFRVTEKPTPRRTANRLNEDDW